MTRPRAESTAAKKPAAKRRPAKPPGEVRIVGGLWKRTRIPVAEVDEGIGLRPTPDRVRETLFNWLGQDLTGLRCVDAFAGTGVLGFEAASRGASVVQLIERETRLVVRLEAMRAKLAAGTTVRIERGDGIAWLRRAATASVDVVFLDPPFGSGLLPAALAAAVRVVVPGGLIYAEAGAVVEAPADLAPEDALEEVRRGRAGAVFFHLFRRVAAAEAAATLPTPPWAPAGDLT